MSWTAVSAPGAKLPTRDGDITRLIGWSAWTVKSSRGMTIEDPEPEMNEEIS